MEPLFYTTIESAKLLRYLLRQQFPDVRCSVRSHQTRNRREDSAGLFFSWETCPHDAAIESLAQTFCRHVYSPTEQDMVESQHYVGQDGVIRTVKAGARVPDGRREVVFCNDYVFAAPTFPAIVTMETPRLWAVHSLPR